MPLAERLGLNGSKSVENRTMASRAPNAGIFRSKEATQSEEMYLAFILYLNGTSASLNHQYLMPSLHSSGELKSRQTQDNNLFSFIGT